jgi:prepilin signal peptidase PulO-like enzyme (type II secretory pathway)
MPWLVVAMVVVGLIAAPLIVYFGPRLAVDRLPESERPALPDARVLVPLVGGRLAGYEQLRTALFGAITCVVLGALAWHFGASRELPLAAAYTLLLLLIGYIDLDFHLVLNKLSYPGILVALALSPLWPGMGPRNALMGAVAGLLTFGLLQLVGRGALGTGDTKLAVLIGMIRGLPLALTALLYGVALGGFAALFAMTVLRKGRKGYIAYAPYLAAGTIISFLLTPP